MIKKKRICVLGLVVFCLLLFSTNIVTAKQEKNEPFFYISQKGKVCFGKQFGKFGELDTFKENGKKYHDWFAYRDGIPIYQKFKFSSQKDVLNFTKYLFGSKMKAQKIKKLDYDIPELGKKEYQIKSFYYSELLKEIWVDFTNEKSSFTLVYKLDNKFNIKSISFS